MAVMDLSFSPANSGSVMAADWVIVSSRLVIGNCVFEQFARKLHAFVRDVIGRAGPLIGIGCFVAEIPCVSFFRQQPEHLTPFDDAPAGRQPVSWPPPGKGIVKWREMLGLLAEKGY